MANRKFSVVTFILLLLLAAAAVNLFFVNHAYRQSMEPVPSPDEASPANATTPDGFPIRHAPNLVMLPPNAMRSWHGDVTMIKSPAGGYDLIVQAIGPKSGEAVPATSVEVDIRRPGNKAAQLTPKLEMQDTGKFVAHIDLPGPGSWEVRTRIHRGLQTMEFAEKFELK